MLEYQDKVIQEVAACTCDRCNKRMTRDDHDSGWHEHVSLSFRGGFESIFGDGNEVSVDLCPQCVRDTLGAWLRITAPEPDWGRRRETGRLSLPPGRQAVTTHEPPAR
ncbi:hypothetical protein SCB29_33915 [Paraburkholderia sp. SIMBA_055]